MAEATDLLPHTISVVSAFVSQNRMAPDDLPAFIAATHAAIAGLSAAPQPAAPDVAEPEVTPAVTARKSLTSKDHILSMIDGKPYKTLKRHLSSRGMTPAEYRDRYKLPATYPMVAENYSAARSEMAKRIGLGRKAGQKVAARKARAPRAPKA